MDYYTQGNVSGFAPIRMTVREHESEIDTLNVISTSEAYLVMFGENKTVRLAGTYQYNISTIKILNIKYYGPYNSRNEVDMLTTSVADYCLENYISEFFCLNPMEHGTKLYACPFGCWEGTCLKV